MPVMYGAMALSCMKYGVWALSHTSLSGTMKYAIGINFVNKLSWFIFEIVVNAVP